MKWRVPLSDVTVGDGEIQAAVEVLQSGWLSQGSRVEAFEKDFAQTLGLERCIAVANGTAALHLAYRAAGLGSGDEFIVPSLTFIATLAAGVALGAAPVLADCASANDLTISVDDVARKITPRTRLIVSMPYGGFCPDMVRLAQLAADKGIPLVEDACHAPLAHIDGRPIGSFGAASTYSFFPNKNMTTGEGGIVATADPEIEKAARLLRSHGMTTPTWDRHRGYADSYDVTEIGYNYRMDELRAAIGTAQLKRLPDVTKRRGEIAAALRETLDPLRAVGLEIPFSQPRGEPVHHLFPILVPPRLDRNEFRATLKEKGVQSAIHYPPLHSFTACADFFSGDNAPNLPVLDAVADRIVTLPMGPHLGDEQIEIIRDAVREGLE